jgi:cytochrome c-type biogenesis protein CcmF
MPMTIAAIDSGPFGDIYVSMGEPVDNGGWIIRVYSKPFITWVWFGFIMMAAGGFLALSDRRYRTAAQSATLPRGAAAEGAP